MNDQNKEPGSETPSTSSASPTPPESPLSPTTPPQQQAAPQYAPPAAPQYGAPQPQHGAPPAAPQYVPQTTVPPSQKTNVLAILSIIFAFVFSIAGIVLGHMALGQIKKTGEGGRGLAMTGLILSYVFTFIGLIIAIFYFVAMATLFGSVDYY